MKIQFAQEIQKANWGNKQQNLDAATVATLRLGGITLLKRVTLFGNAWGFE